MNPSLMLSSRRPSCCSRRWITSFKTLMAAPMKTKMASAMRSLGAPMWKEPVGGIHKYAAAAAQRAVATSPGPSPPSQAARRMAGYAVR